MHFLSAIFLYGINCDDDGNRLELENILCKSQSFMQFEVMYNKNDEKQITSDMYKCLYYKISCLKMTMLDLRNDTTHSLELNAKVMTKSVFDIINYFIA